MIIQSENHTHHISVHNLKLSTSSGKFWYFFRTRFQRITNEWNTSLTSRESCLSVMILKWFTYRISSSIRAAIENKSGKTDGKSERRRRAILVITAALAIVVKLFFVKKRSCHFRHGFSITNFTQFSLDLIQQGEDKNLLLVLTEITLIKLGKFEVFEKKIVLFYSLCIIFFFFNTLF